MDFVTIIILIIIAAVVGVVYGIISAINTSGKQKVMEDGLNSLLDFSASQTIMGCDGDSGIAVDEKQKKICIIKQNMGLSKFDVYTYQDILSAEIFEDGITVIETSRASQLGGALVGGIALGGAGAIIGGLSGKKISSGKVSGIGLRVTVNNTVEPIHDVKLLDIESKRDSFLFKSAMEQARHWHALMSILIRAADGEVSKNEGTNSVVATSVATEIERLYELQKKGLLTNEEFLTQKTKLLSS